MKSTAEAQRAEAQRANRVILRAGLADPVESLCGLHTGMREITIRAITQEHNLPFQEFRTNPGAYRRDWLVTIWRRGSHHTYVVSRERALRMIAILRGIDSEVWDVSNAPRWGSESVFPGEYVHVRARGAVWRCWTDAERSASAAAEADAAVRAERKRDYYASAAGD